MFFETTGVVCINFIHDLNSDNVAWDSTNGLTHKTLQKICFNTVEQPPFSCNLSPSGCHLFELPREALWEQWFFDNEAE